MQYAIVNYSKINLGNRIDAEYFQPAYLQTEEKLKKNNAIQLRNYCSITGSAFYPAATHLYKFGDLPFIRCVDCIPYPFITKRQNTLFEKIPLDFANSHKNIKRLKKGEIVITKVGSPCYASIIHDLDDVALSRTVLGLKSINDIDPYYFVAFLRSKYGFMQLYRERELTIQYQLTLDRVGGILVYKPTDKKLEKLISQCMYQFENFKNQSENLFSKVQLLLQNQLKLTSWNPKHKLSFIKNFSETQRANRIDAEYFQPKYEEIVKSIKSYKGGWDTLGNLVNIKKGIEVGSGEYLDKGFPFVRVSNLSPFEITEEKYISQQLYTELKDFKPKFGEILLSKDATPGIAYYFKERPKPMIPSGGILRLKSKTKKINNESLTLILNSILTKEQINRDVGGSVILHWRPEQVKETIIPILWKKPQKIIKQKVNESLKLRKQSMLLLEYAKQAVEIAIEKDEKIAIEWLKDKTKDLTNNKKENIN